MSGLPVLSYLSDGAHPTGAKSVLSFLTKDSTADWWKNFPTAFGFFVFVEQ